VSGQNLIGVIGRGDARLMVCEQLPSGPPSTLATFRLSRVQHQKREGQHRNDSRLSGKKMDGVKAPSREKAREWGRRLWRRRNEWIARESARHWQMLRSDRFPIRCNHAHLPLDTCISSARFLHAYLWVADDLAPCSQFGAGGGREGGIGPHSTPRPDRKVRARAIVVLGGGGTVRRTVSMRAHDEPARLPQSPRAAMCRIAYPSVLGRALLRRNEQCKSGSHTKGARCRQTQGPPFPYSNQPGVSEVGVLPTFGGETPLSQGRTLRHGNGDGIVFLGQAFEGPGELLGPAAAVRVRSGTRTGGYRQRSKRAIGKTPASFEGTGVAQLDP